MRKIITCLLASVLLCTTIMCVPVNAVVGTEVYVLVKTKAEMQALVTEYTNAVKEDIEVTEGTTDTETVESNADVSVVYGKSITEGRLCVTMLNDSISVRESGTAWPEDLQELYSLASTAGLINTTVITNTPTGYTEYAYLVHAECKNTGIVYLSENKEVKIYFTDIKDIVNEIKQDLEEGNNASYTMTGQVELRDVTEFADDFLRIKDELSSKNNNTGVYSVLNTILNVVGWIFVAYAILFIVCYIVDMFNPFQKEIELFRIITFYRWRSSYCVDDLVVGLYQDTQKSNLFSLKKAIVYTIIYAGTGVVMIAINWISIAQYVYAMLT